MLQKDSSRILGMLFVGEFECRVALPVRKFEGKHNAVLVTTYFHTFQRGIGCEIGVLPLTTLP